jgi:EAL domain-containing protein (putative c-di-GMP-specific phosphodiesterase class I)
MGVVAEGVETREQLTFLRQEVCNEAQSYLFSKPVSPGVPSFWCNNIR